jgi:hypothetical protein
MNKYCQECGENNSEEAAYCFNCGKKLEFIIYQNKSFEKNESNDYQNYEKNQTYQTTRRPIKKYGFITMISVISVVAILVGAYLISGYLYNDNIKNPTINKIPVKGGPKFNIESIVNSGNAFTSPDVGHTAVYGYYLSGVRLGEVSFTTVGEENYNGEQCYKITGNGNFNFDIYGQSMSVDFNIDAYISQSDGKLVYFYYNFDINQPFNIDMDMIMDINKENGEITVTVDSSMIGSSSTVIKTSEEYWDCTLLKDDLFVGYLNEVIYTMNVLGYDTEVSLKISVIGKEDITVKKGTFEDCYIVQIDQDQGYVNSTSTIWIDENGICPKMQIGSSSTSSISYEGMTIELEEYYTT